jgi:long-chain acyl-CoA synthetase
MNVAAWLDRTARAEPARIAVLHGTAPWATYGALAQRAARLAAGLRGRLGLAPGERVALRIAEGAVVALPREDR